ncbi:MAG: VacJ family lipoprotein [Geminicoccaceae bacterium]
MRPLRALAGLALAAGLAACAATPAEDLGSGPPDNVITPEQERYSILDRDSDPFQGFNQGVYTFNAWFDRWFFLPATNAYRFVTPNFVEDRVSSFFNNLKEFRNGTNAALQGKPDNVGVAFARLFINSTVGIFGLFDWATEFGYTVRPEDFGQTLGVWGVPAGPYLVLPILGPSGVRDAFGLGVDTAVSTFVPPMSIIDEQVFFTPAVYLLYAVDQRRQVQFRYFDTGTPFEYEYVRFFYRKKRDLDVMR